MTASSVLPIPIVSAPASGTPTMRFCRGRPDEERRPQVLAEEEKCREGDAGGRPDSRRHAAHRLEIERPRRAVAA